MQIQKLGSLNISRKYDYITNPKQATKKSAVSFSANPDEFIKAADGALEPVINALKKQFQNVLDKANKPKTYSNIIEQINEIQSQNKEMAEISEQYQIILDNLKKSSSKDLDRDAKAVGDFIDTMNKLGANKGFKRVAGYENIKSKLRNEFIFGKMMMARTSQNTEVPNALIVHGLPNNGKSLFAEALAEESLSELKIVDIANLRKEAQLRGISEEELAIEKIENYANESKKNYVESKDKKQRTIILVNEAENIANPMSSVYKKFRDIINNCSDKYKCTLFLTSNHTEFFAEEILSKKITPIKIGIEPADKETAKKIIDKMLIDGEKFPQEGTEKIVNALFKDPNKRYSNGAIGRVIKNTLSEFYNTTPSVNNYMYIIERNDVRPSITKEHLNEFYKTKEALGG